MASVVTFLSNVLSRPVESYCSFGPTVSEITFGLLGYSFNPERDINDLSGKVVFVTGGVCSLYTLGYLSQCANFSAPSQAMPV